MINTKSFMQITFRYEFVQVFFQDTPALLKHLNGGKFYGTWKKNKKEGSLSCLFQQPYFFYFLFICIVNILTSYWF